MAPFTGRAVDAAASAVAGGRERCLAAVSHQRIAVGPARFTLPDLALSADASGQSVRHGITRVATGPAMLARGGEVGLTAVGGLPIAVGAVWLALGEQALGVTARGVADPGALGEAAGAVVAAALACFEGTEAGLALVVSVAVGRRGVASVEDTAVVEA